MPKSPSPLQSDVAAPPARAPGYRTIALIIACALFMEQLDATVLATALPTMARDFGVPVTDLSSALTSYLLALAIFIPISGWLADRYGARTMFRLAIVVFMGGSLLSARAPLLPVVITARFIQGMGGAMMIPIGRLVLLQSVSKEDRIQAMSWLVMPSMLGPIVGPPLGGFVVTYLNWRWIFYLNLPIGLLGLALATKFVRPLRGERPAPVDMAGFVLSGISLSCLLFGFEMASRSGEGRQALGLVAVGLVVGALYIRHANRADHPILDLRLLKTPTFRLSLIGGSLTRITQGAHPFLLPLMLQVGFGVSAAVSGSITLAGASGAVLMKVLAPKILKQFGFRNSMIANGLIASATYALCGFLRPSWPVPAIFCLLMAAGFFMSFQFTAYNVIAYDEISPQQMSPATSFYATFQQLLLSLGVCTGAAALHLGMLVNHHTSPQIGEFTAAFLMVSAVSALATIWNMRFSPTAGDGLIGRSTNKRT